MLRAGRTFSFEFFPPKNDAEQATLVQHPAGAGAARARRSSPSPTGAAARSRQRTHDLVAGMLRTTTLTPMAHLICVAHSRLELAEILVPPQGRGGEPDGARRRPADRPGGRRGRARARRRAGRAGPGHRRVLDRRGRPPGRPPPVARLALRPATTWPPSCGWPTSPSPSSSSPSRSTCRWSTIWPPSGSTSRSCPASCRSPA